MVETYDFAQDQGYRTHDGRFHAEGGDGVPRGEGFQATEVPAIALFISICFFAQRDDPSRSDRNRYHPSREKYISGHRSMSTSQRWPRKSPSGLIMVAPDHRRPAFGRDGVEFLLAHPQAILDKENMDFVKKNREELLKDHENKYLLVFQEKLVGAFDSYEKAAEEGVRLFGMDANFLVYHSVEKEPLNFIVEAQT